MDSHISESSKPEDKFLIDTYQLGITPDVSDALRRHRDPKVTLTDKQIADIIAEEFKNLTA